MSQFRIHFPEDNKLVVRESFIIAFFVRGSYDKIINVVPGVFEHWLDKVVGKGDIWALVGAHATGFFQLDGDTLDQVRQYLEPSKIRQRKNIYVIISQGEDAHCPDFRFTVSGKNQPGDDLENSLIEICLPMELVEKSGYSTIVDVALSLAEQIPYDSAYASPYVMRGWENSHHLEYAGAKLYPFALRHPGYDLAENTSTQSVLGGHCRGARWLTLLGPHIIRQLGGREAITTQLKPPIQVIEAGNGLMIQAGHRPETGDVNRAQGPALLPAVAKLLEPVTLFEDYGSFSHYFSLEEDDEEKIERWEGRLFD